jgi:hypothetical protein
MLLGTVAASTTTTFNLPFTPQSFTFANITTITGFKVTPQGGTPVIDLDAAGLAALRNQRQQSAVTTFSDFMAANGVVKDKACLVEITNGATVSTVYHTSYSNQTPATAFLTSTRETVLVGASQRFEKFAVLACPSAASTDYFMIEFADGVTQRFERDELRNLLSKFQAVTNDANDYKIDNLDGWIKAVEFTATSQQIVYIQRFVKTAGGLN